MAERSGVNRAGYLRESYHYFHLRDSAGQELDYHFHEFDKLVILISGRVDYLVEDRSYPLEPWTVLLVRHRSRWWKCWQVVLARFCRWSSRFGRLAARRRRG